MYIDKGWFVVGLIKNKNLWFYMLIWIILIYKKVKLIWKKEKRNCYWNMIIILVFSKIIKFREINFLRKIVFIDCDYFV